MTLNNKIIERIKAKSHLLFDKVGDFDILSSYIFKETGRTIGITTLKRLFSYINDDRSATEYTLNTISIYLGYNDWEDLSQAVNIDSIWGYEDESVYIHALEIGTHIEVSYLNRRVKFVVARKGDKNILRVEKVENSSLQVGDECVIYKISIGALLEAEKIYRGNIIGNYRTNGEIKSIVISCPRLTYSNGIMGAIIGDVVGSRWEFNPTNDYNFEWLSKENDFTDDTICTIAVADALLHGRDFGDSIHDWCNRYPHPKGGYGGRFAVWVHSMYPKPYDSFGNGSAMRVSPVAYWYNTRIEVLDAAAATALPSHSHPEGIKGAQTVALAIYKALQWGEQAVFHIDEILSECAQFSGYDINIKKENVINCFDETCQGTVPVALWIIKESTSFEDAIRKAISLGADADTLGAIVGSIAEAIWGIPEEIEQSIMGYLPVEMRKVLERFREKVKDKNSSFASVPSV